LITNKSLCFYPMRPHVGTSGEKAAHQTGLGLGVTFVPTHEQIDLQTAQ
jgi:hypothetical protein